MLFFNITSIFIEFSTTKTQNFISRDEIIQHSKNKHAQAPCFNVRIGFLQTQKVENLFDLMKIICIKLWNVDNSCLLRRPFNWK